MICTQVGFTNKYTHLEARHSFPSPHGDVSHPKMRLRSARVVKDVVAASTSSASGSSTKRGAAAVVAAAPSKRGKAARVEADAIKGDGIWTLGGPDQLVRAVLVKRPSAVIRSPYVADVRVEGESGESLAWVPCLDLGGTCVPGATLLMTRSTNPSTKTQYAVQVRCQPVQRGVIQLRPNPDSGGVQVGGVSGVGLLHAQGLSCAAF